MRIIAVSDTHSKHRETEFPVNEVGDFELYNRLASLKNLKYHICGHIHECYGIYTDSNLSCRVINASSLNSHYDCVNRPFILSL